MTAFKDFPLRLVVPTFDSPLTDVIMDLQYLRRHRLGGSIPPGLFFQLKGIFQILESFGSARIEGNRTTIAELVESRITPLKDETDPLREIANMEKALSFIGEVVEENTGISKALILELHKQTVENLIREGDPTPGYFRKKNVSISGSNHTPPDYMQVDPYMDELISFINKPFGSKYDLLKIALAHHRFAWVHPFRNGNGRVVRLLTYAMLIERGFNVGQGRILNPSAVFCIDRDTYYAMLEKADSGEDSGLLAWCEYVLRGLLDELTKIDKLLDYDSLSDRILQPAIAFVRERELITDQEAAILRVAVRKQIFQSSDIAHLMPKKLPAERSRILGKMKKEKLIEPIEENARRYVLGLSKGNLLRGIIYALGNENFIPADT